MRNAIVGQLVTGPAFPRQSTYGAFGTRIGVVESVVARADGTRVARVAFAIRDYSIPYAEKARADATSGDEARRVIRTLGIASLKEIA